MAVRVLILKKKRKLEFNWRRSVKTQISLSTVNVKKELFTLSLGKAWENAFQILQSTLVISKSKGPSKTLRHVRTSTCQICSIEEKNI